MSKLQVLCNHCGMRAEFTTGATVYPSRPELHGLKFWVCTPCGAWVGTHKAGSWEPAADGTRIMHNGDEPFGVLAKESHRRAKTRAHAAFDPIWRDGGPMSRKQAYAWLAAALGIPAHECHIGALSEEQCNAVAALAKAYLRTAKA